MPKKIIMGGVCGMGMAPLALFLRGENLQIEGFDDNPDPSARRMLENAGVKFSGRASADFKGADSLIFSSALKREFEKFIGLAEKPFFRRGEALAKIAEKRRLIGVCGSHGKTTTTTLISHAILAANLDAGFITGAMPAAFAPAKYCAEGKILAAELDESDGTIENFRPEITVALNADLDHTDTYKNSAEIEKMFERLFSRTSRAILVPAGDEALIKAARRAKTSAKIEIVKTPGRGFFEFDKAMALAALNAAFGGSFTPEIFGGFRGVKRRQETIFNSEKIFAVADYAHHPREVIAFLEYFSEIADTPKLVFFQPHRYSRTKYFGRAFRKIFKSLAESGVKTAILPVYAASEPFDPLGTSKNLESENVMLADFAQMAKIIRDFSEEKSSKISVAFVGAGDIYFKAREIFENERF